MHINNRQFCNLKIHSFGDANKYPGIFEEKGQKSQKYSLSYINLSLKFIKLC